MSHKMTTYHWQGISKRGQLVKGVITARSLALAKVELKSQGIMIQKISKYSWLFSIKKRKIKSSEVVLFSRQLALLLASGISIIRAFDIVIQGQNKLPMVFLLENIKETLSSGKTLADALKKFPDCFNELFCNLIAVGEKSGSLIQILEIITTYKERLERIKNKLKKSLTYPLIITLVASLVTIGLLVFIVPQFETLFNDFGADLPAFTCLIIHLSKILQMHMPLILILLLISSGSFLYLYKKTAFAPFLDNIALRLVFIGPLLQQTIIARFARTISIALTAGLPLIDALTIAAKVTDNIMYENAVIRMKEEIANGQPIHKTMSNTQLFPYMAIQMVAVGEESSTLAYMFNQIADFYEEHVNNKVDVLSNLLEPVIMALLGLLIGGIIIALYLPIFKLGAII
jgi:type IV pilus assembly protein PilC